jgi:nucleoid-associated protein YgaU
LLMVIFAAFPEMAEAQQEAYGDSTQADQNNEKGNIEGAAQRLVVVEPGDSLWSITQERLGQGASPQQILNEVERTFELNRDLLGDDSDLILPGQELSLPVAVAGTSAIMPQATPQASPAISEPAAKPTPEPTPEPGPTAAAPTAAIPKEEPVAGESSVTKAKAPEEQPAAEQPAEEQSAEEQPTEEQPATSEQGEEGGGGIEQQSDEPSSLLPEASPTEEDPSSVASVEESLRSKLQDISKRQVGLVILGLTFLVAIAMAWKLPMRRNLRDPQAAQRVHYLGQTNDHLSYRGGDGREETQQRRASFESPDPDKPLHGSRVEALTKQNDIDRSEMIVVAAAASGRRKKVLSMRAPGERRLLRKRHAATAYDPYIRSSLRHSPGTGVGLNNGQKALRRAPLRTPLRAYGRR